jgi:hypothetical protein
MLPNLLSEEFLSAANPYLLQAEIASAALLGVGIIFEADKYPASVHKSAFWFVVMGVVLETVFSILLFASEERIASLQRGTIASLEMQLAARSLSPDQIAKMSTVLRLYGSMGFAAYPYPDDKESVDIANNIRSALTGAGWYNQEDPNVISPAPGVMAGISVQVGLGAPENTKEAATALVHMLDDANGSATLRLMPAADLSRPFVSVGVGIKP